MKLECFEISPSSQRTTPSLPQYSNYVMYGPWIGKDIPILNKCIAKRSDNLFVYLIMHDIHYKVVIPNSTGTTFTSMYMPISNNSSLYNSLIYLKQKNNHHNRLCSIRDLMFSEYYLLYYSQSLKTYMKYY